MKYLIVHSKWSKVSRRARPRRCKQLGGKAHFLPIENRIKWNRDKPIRLKIWHTVHYHGEHSSCIGLKHPMWERAINRFNNHYPRFPFQLEWTDE